MTDPAYAHFAILADRTGSMGQFADGMSGPTKADLATGGIHDLIRKQAAEPGRATFSLTQFDTSPTSRWPGAGPGPCTERVASFAAADDPLITKWRIRPRGSTPLLDAVGTEIVRTGEELAALPENARPGRVYFVIGTDGEENASREYSKQQIAAMVARQHTDWHWEFVFIGADIDAFAEAGGMGFAAGSTMSSSGARTVQAYAGTSSAISRSRIGGQSVSYTDEERAAAAGTGKPGDEE